MPLNFKKVGRGHVQKDAVTNSDIYAGMVTRNMTEPTYTTSTDGTSISLTAAGRQKSGARPGDGGSPTFGARQPKGMLLRTSEGPAQVHVLPTR